MTQKKETRFERLERLHKALLAQNLDSGGEWGLLIRQHKLVAAVLEAQRCGSHEEVQAACAELEGLHGQLNGEAQ